MPAVIWKPAEAVKCIGDQLGVHRLTVLGPRDDFAARLNSIDGIGGLHISTLRYGTEVELGLETGGEHLLITTQISGQTLLRSRGAETSGGPGFTIVHSSPGAVTKRFSADSCRVNLRISRQRLDDAWVRLTGEDPGSPIVFDALVEDKAVVQRWQSTLGLLLHYAAADHVLAARQAEVLADSALLSLLLEFPHSAQKVLARKAPPKAATGRLSRALELMRTSIDEPLTLTAIASECGVSVRTLTQLFRVAQGVSPMRYLQELRLTRAREQLRRGSSETTVTAAALSCGFTGLGRFSALYRQRFGELPSQTLARR